LSRQLSALGFETILASRGAADAGGIHPDARPGIQKVASTRSSASFVAMITGPPGATGASAEEAEEEGDGLWAVPDGAE
jgi:hypothetical protein